MINIDKMFDNLIYHKQYTMIEEYLEILKDKFPRYEEYRTKMYVAKAEDLTQQIVQEDVNR